MQLYILKKFVGAKPDLNSRYDATWSGPAIGMSFEIPFSQLLVTADIRYSQLGYEAEADWNLISDFQHPVSFRHQAKGISLMNQVGIGYHLNDNITCAVSASRSVFKTGQGEDRLFHADGTVAITRLNSVYRNAVTVMASFAIKIN